MNKKIPVIVSNVFGFDFEDAQPVNTAIMTSGAAEKAVRIQLINQACILIDPLVETLKISHLVFYPSGFS